MTSLSYEEKKEIERQRNRQKTSYAQDIAPLPEVIDIKRKEQASKSFKYFCETYFKDVFYLEWSEIHLKVIEKIERVINNGEIFALAMPRGSGKTSLFQIAVIWAAITGRVEFVVLIAANANRANALLEDMKIWLETNDLLLEDYGLTRNSFIEEKNGINFDPYKVSELKKTLVKKMPNLTITNHIKYL